MHYLKMHVTNCINSLNKVWNRYEKKMTVIYFYNMQRGGNYGKNSPSLLWLSGISSAMFITTTWIIHSLSFQI
jgi:hypothetical protein